MLAYKLNTTKLHCLLTDSISLTLLTTELWSVSQSAPLHLNAVLYQDMTKRTYPSVFLNTATSEYFTLGNKTSLM